MKYSGTIFLKQVKETLKNKEVLIQFVLFPLMAFCMTKWVPVEGMPENFFVQLFAAMFVGMAPLTSMSSLLAEEKEKNTLRVLWMANVKPAAYFIGVGGYLWIACMLGAGAFCLIGGYEGRAAGVFLALMAVGILISLLFGAAIGMWSRGQMAATSVTVPVMMVFSLVPMMCMFNDTIAKFGRFLYSRQLSLLIAKVEQPEFSAESILILAGNFLAAAGVFAAAYKKRGKCL